MLEKKISILLLIGLASYIMCYYQLHAYLATIELYMKQYN